MEGYYYDNRRWGMGGEMVWGRFGVEWEGRRVVFESEEEE